MPFNRNRFDARQEGQPAHDAQKLARRALDGDVVIHGDRRLIMRSPNGHFWSVSVDDSGALTATDIGTEAPE